MRPRQRVRIDQEVSRRRGRARRRSVGTQSDLDKPWAGSSARFTGSHWDGQRISTAMTWALASTRPRGGLEVGGERPESILARAFRGKVLQCRCIIVCEQCGELVAAREWNDASSASSSSAQPAIDVDATIVIAAARLRHRDHRAPTSCHVSASEFLPQRASKSPRPKRLFHPRPVCCPGAAIF